MGRFLSSLRASRDCLLILADCLLLHSRAVGAAFIIASNADLLNGNWNGRPDVFIAGAEINLRLRWTRARAREGEIAESLMNSERSNYVTAH
jgi:hypothetical protein